MSNLLNDTIIIHKHSHECGGIGDFIRASLSFYSLCKRYNYKYYINFDDNLYLKECFEIENIPIELDNFSKEELIILNGVYDENNIQPYLDKIKNKKIYYLKSNAIGFESNEKINIIRNEYFKNILIPSQKVNNFINNIYSKYNLIDNNYISIHIRCGDKNMTNNNNDVNNYDNRINLENNDIYTFYNNIINKFYKKYGSNLPLVIHSDSATFKTKIKEINNKCIILDLDIKHIAENIGINNENSFVSTVGEFYIISKAKKIYLPNVYSGFSHIASIIEGKELFTNFDSFYFSFLNVNNIKIDKII
jgi:hypothetical protein